MLHGGKTPWPPFNSLLSSQHEYPVDPGCCAAPVQRRRILFWRSGHRRQRAGLGSVDMPGRLGYGWIPHQETLTEIPLRILKDDG